MSLFAEFLLITVVCILTVLLTFAGVQTILFIRELRATLKKLNSIPLNDFMTHLRTVVNQTETQNIEIPADKVIPPGQDKTFRRFFHRSGLPLHS